MCDISIVIPCYNPNKKYLEDCINSILIQSFQDFEVILVDDGSKEEYKTLFEDIQKKDKRITVIHQENKGVSCARNTGIHSSSGKYIAFVDADDIISSDYLKESYQLLKEYKTEFIIGGLIPFEDTVTEQKLENPDVLVFDSNINELKSHLIGDRIMFGNKAYINRGPVSRLIARDLAIKYGFPEDIHLGEDFIWNLKVLSNIDKAVAVKQVWYYYRINSESATHKYDPDIYEKILAQVNTAMEYIDFNDKIQYKAFGNTIFEGLKAISSCYINHSNGNKKDKQKLLNIIYKDQPWNFVGQKEYLSVANRNEKIKGLLYKYKVLFFAWKYMK